MVRKEITLRHLGKKSAVSFTASRERVEAFVRALVQDGFFIESKRESNGKKRWILGRKIGLMAGDWPMKVMVEQRPNTMRPDEGEIAISCFLFTPWSWIITLAVMLFFFLPFIPIKGGVLVFPVGLGVVAIAIHKQRMDLSPDATWQGPPRQRWNDKIARLIRDTFVEE
uniref:Uncharacterized protein n=1 Tax=Candidatus Kentrum sp. DK TaxID=2126562 RepID=A0A450SDP4_9GAMM|nr:MAG: hypothetical protein BECKDK2373C_GA0170839_102929 [Candidatus Kentron sp. DK]VFJ54531.1 MAG: hypothetical protein BECKDK2373B_GA0170837_10479 [Candidatus Kentron sp. DK]